MEEVLSAKDFLGLCVKQWTDFLADVGKPVQPVLYQHLTDRIFNALIDNHFHMHYLQQDITDTPTSNERNAIRYVAGYVCHHLCL